MTDPESLEAMSTLLDSISSACVTLDSVKGQDAKRILAKATEDAATHLAPARTASVAQLKPAPKERPL